MDFKWFITFRVLVFNGFLSAIAFPLIDPYEAFKFFDLVAEIRDNSYETSAIELVNEMFAFIEGVCDSDHNAIETIVDIFDKEKLLRYAESNIQFLEKYKTRLPNFKKKNQEYMGILKKTIVGGVWKGFVGSGKQRMNQLRFYMNWIYSIRRLIEHVDVWIFNLTDIRATKLFLEPLGKSIKCITDTIEKVHKLQNEMNNKEIMKAYPNILESAKALFNNYLENLDDYNDILERDLQLLVTVVRNIECVRG
ncbi:uncharacterized protein BdWA1_004071 [Babesia duncani]|uniref:Uncharacterized protein n=1 Tax=Babesia duncani TaxID=323732 RepID=A0AAD9PGP0_9APIC|nr:hypothetical protein BdWA1_004117 [Babesia duncani]KAK2194416.1 hypothetical protein BdWA1_004119 [Babesia duncani]KAK2194418.1 hypothetical protein BdWA1_004121 [Babesia duncani]KAK2194464.1 hypothetical protein BdWA1_004069 [Babesia duncani]KAK2194466.1 hypothetical protein BdWA1_004071 [Babesia duncani]